MYTLKALYLLAFLLVSLGVSACSGGRVGTFTDTCVTEAKLDQMTCACMAKKASEELSPTGVDFLIATMRKDKEQTGALRSQLDPSEAMPLAMFMPRASAECAPEQKVN